MLDSILILIPYLPTYVNNQDLFNAAFVRYSIKENAVPQPGPYSKSRFGHKAKEMQKLGIYFPQISLEGLVVRGTKYHGQATMFIQIQCSVPKLLFGSSYYEVLATHFGQTCDKLEAALLEVGLQVPRSCITSAIVKRIDFSKNIYFVNGENTKDFVTTLEKYDYKAGADFQKTRFGRQCDYQMVNHFRKSKNFKFYDKMEELRSNGFTPVELALAARTDLQTLRIECSLNKNGSANRAITKARKALGLPQLKQYTLADVFHEGVARRVLMTELQQVINLADAHAFTFETCPDEKILEVIRTHITTTARAYEILYFIRRFLKVGLAQTHAELKKQHGRKVSRHMKEIRAALSMLPPAKTKRFKISKRLHDEVDAFDLQTGVVI